MRQCDAGSSNHAKGHCSYWPMQMTSPERFACVYKGSTSGIQAKHKRPAPYHVHTSTVAVPPQYANTTLGTASHPEASTKAYLLAGATGASTVNHRFE